MATFEADALHMQAGRDLQLEAALVRNTGDGATVIAAKRDIVLGTVSTSSALNSTQDSRNYQKTRDRADVGTTIHTSGDLTLIAGNNIQARAADLEAGKNIRLVADNNITLQAGQATARLESQQHSDESDGVTSKSHDTQTQSSSAETQASTLNARSISVQAGNHW